MPCCTETNKTHTLLADSITLSFGRQNVLNGAWLRSETGRVTGLLGRNGSISCDSVPLRQVRQKSDDLLGRFRLKYASEVSAVGDSNRVSAYSICISVPAALKL